ncbi:MAG: RDD family protein, partial [Opitutales bacterium]
PAAVAPAPAPTTTPAVVPALPESPEKVSDGTEAAQQLAEKARAAAEQIAEKARADAEKIADHAREEAERIADQARTEAEKAGENARVAAEKIGEEARVKAELAVEKSGADAGTPDQPVHHRHRTSRDSSEDSVAVMNDNVVPAGVKVNADAVAVMGNLTVDGEVMNDAVAVMGNNTINGTVHGNVVDVMGDITLGPKARVEGDLVNVGGTINRDPGAVVNGQVQVKSIGPGLHFDPLRSWWSHGLKLGRPLAIGAHLGWLWIITAFSVAFYALLGLVFPDKIRKCGDKLVQEPGLTILASVLGVLALPVLFVLLCITLIGIPVALFILPLGTLLLAMFGKAAIYGLVGRRLTGDRWHPALSVILGALLFVLLYLVPFAGLLLSLLVWFLGFGCVVLTIFTRAPKPAVAPVVPPVPPAAPSSTAPAEPPVLPAAAAGLAAAAVPPVMPVEMAPAAPLASDAGGAAVSSPAPAPAAQAVPAPAAPRLPFTADTLPRAGFWIRVGAAFLDFLLVGVGSLILTHVIFGSNSHDGPGPFFLALIAYHVAMWKYKGTTIGGVICHLRVVRIDDRPIDWGVAAVRALTAFLSVMVFGLGFIWVA